MTAEAQQELRHGVVRILPPIMWKTIGSAGMGAAFGVTAYAPNMSQRPETASLTASLSTSFLKGGNVGNLCLRRAKILADGIADEY